MTKTKTVWIFAAVLMGCGMPVPQDDGAVGNDSGMVTPDNGPIMPGTKELAQPCNSNSDCKSTYCAVDPGPMGTGDMVCTLQMSGMPCSNWMMCPGGTCRNGMCGAAADNQPCLQNGQCNSNMCSRSSPGSAGFCF